jgi:DNA-binding transcriptional regulator WhiA
MKLSKSAVNHRLRRLVELAEAGADLDVRTPTPVPRSA